MSGNGRNGRKDDQGGRGRKRANTESVDDLRTNTIHAQITEVFPKVHAATLRYKIKAMLRKRIPDGKIVDSIANTLTENKGNFQPRDLRPDDGTMTAGPSSGSTVAQPGLPDHNNNNNNNVTLVKGKSNIVGKGKSGAMTAGPSGSTAVSRAAEANDDDDDDDDNNKNDVTMVKGWWWSRVMGKGSGGGGDGGDGGGGSEEEETGDYECQCCFFDCAFHNMVQCCAGHLFCKRCMRQYAQSVISGEGKATLACMTQDCTEGFPRSLLEAAFCPKTMTSLEEREQEESVRLASAAAEGRGESLKQCPHCPFKAFLPPGNKVLECQTPSCKKETCVVCGEDWADHCGIPCAELEKTDEASLRKKAEEKMTAALLRVCHKCNVPLIKHEGCNKLTCRCGAMMCYICRKPIKDYSHFDLRQGNVILGQIGLCSLWTNPKEDDDRAIEEIRREAEQEKEANGFVNDRKIGAPKSLGKKKK